MFIGELNTAKCDINNSKTGKCALICIFYTSDSDRWDVISDFFNRV
jgi:hypothetical protein